MENRIPISRILLIVFLLYFPEIIFGQDFSFLGPRSFSLGQTSTTLSDEYSIFNNPGTLGVVRGGSMTSGFMSLYQIEGLSSVFAAITAGFNNGALSIGVFRLGDDIYRNNKLSLGFGNRFGLAALGMGINYHHYYFEGLDSYGFVTIDVGGIAEISPQISIGACVKNITQTRMSRFTGEYFPTLMSTGISFKPTDLITLNAQYDKNLDHPGLLKFGLEYSYSSLVLRAGFVTNPSLLSFGIGFHHKKLRIDYAIAKHQVLDSSHMASISYYFKDE